jgi:hypothetical protein
MIARYVRSNAHGALQLVAASLLDVYSHICLSTTCSITHRKTSSPHITIAMVVQYG